MRGGVSLRRAARSDWDLVHGWLARADIQDWWGPLSATESEVNMALASQHAICRIIMADGDPVGYAHAVDATLWGDSLPQDLEPGTWDLDLFIA
jgi:aminoglycoside 6'-N-acetyltransferase